MGAWGDSLSWAIPNTPSSTGCEEAIAGARGMAIVLALAAVVVVVAIVVVV